MGTDPFMFNFLYVLITLSLDFTVYLMKYCELLNKYVYAMFTPQCLRLLTVLWKYSLDTNPLLL